MGHIFLAHDTPNEMAMIERMIIDEAASLTGGVVTVKKTSQDECDQAIDAAESANQPFQFALIDLFLSEPPNWEAPEGLVVADRLLAESPDCFIVFVSAKDEGKLKETGLYAKMRERSGWIVSLNSFNRDYRSQLIEAIELGLKSACKEAG